MRILNWFISFDGRIGRIPFWIGNATVALVLFLTERLAAKSGSAAAGQILAFAGTFALYPWAALASQRAADRGRPAVYGIVLVILILLAALGAQLLPAGTAGTALGLLSGLAWLVALVDLGLLPGRGATAALAAARTSAKPAP